MDKAQNGAAQPFMLTIDGARSYTGLTANRIYTAINAGQLDVRQIGRRTMVMGDSLRAFCDALPKAPVRPKPAKGKQAA